MFQLPLPSTSPAGLAVNVSRVSGDGHGPVETPRMGLREASPFSGGRSGPSPRPGGWGAGLGTSGQEVVWGPALCGLARPLQATRCSWSGRKWPQPSGAQPSGARPAVCPGRGGRRAGGGGGRPCFSLFPDHDLPSFTCLFVNSFFSTINGNLCPPPPPPPAN